VKSILIAALLAAAPAEPAKRSCLTEAQLEDLTFFALPPMLDGLATKCGPSLPADAYVLNGGRALARTLEPEGLRRFAGANSALGAMGSSKLPPGISASTAIGLLRDTAATELFGKLTPEDCVRANRLAELLSPLPSDNLAGLIAVIIELGVADGKRKTSLAICPTARP
jgi:hypothetical protein